VALADKPQDPSRAPKSEGAARQKPAAEARRARKAPRAPVRKAGPSLFQRIFGARKPELDALPHARFSDTPQGIRSFVVAGHGSPTVVFESGLGHGKRIWGPVFNGVSAVTRAVAYDRAGYGQSEPSTQPRSGLQIVAELRALLETEGFAPPYVLVGHSLGGTYMKLYAKMYPNEVAGVVLVDARHSEFTQRCRQLGVPRLLYEPPEALLSLLSPTPRAELEAAPLSLKQARKGGVFPPVPLIVLTQSNAAARWPAQLGKVWAASQRNLAKLSSLGRIKVLDDAGHNVHVDRPDVVVRAVLNVVRAARYLRHQSRRR
jgi:pimeloyl-ACP methyl ester carboxylesterase